ncbi:hypothetical protein CCR75_005554 [Bremia lactucae]|uniref:Uncharacterized protein n=1 Tax=Bremia lactucae TaxID=4779 RepID=A0A976FL97_BRELC|nr:hypothetical protein CCR75_005554 [Bremia lactucae]
MQLCSRGGRNGSKQISKSISSPFFPLMAQAYSFYSKYAFGKFENKMSRSMVYVVDEVNAYADIMREHIQFDAMIVTLGVVIWCIQNGFEQIMNWDCQESFFVNFSVGGGEVKTVVVPEVVAPEIGIADVDVGEVGADIVMEVAAIPGANTAVFLKLWPWKTQRMRNNVKKMRWLRLRLGCCSSSHCAESSDCSNERKAKESVADQIGVEIVDGGAPGKKMSMSTMPGI